MWSTLWAVGKWLLRVSAKIGLWSIAHPTAALIVAGSLQLASKWLEKQPWAGADIVSSLVGAFGTGLFVTGVGAWLVGTLFPGVTAVAKGAGALASWWTWLSFGGARPFGVFR